MGEVSMNTRPSIDSSINTSSLSLMYEAEWCSFVPILENPSAMGSLEDSSNNLLICYLFHSRFIFHSRPSTSKLLRSWLVSEIPSNPKM